MKKIRIFDIVISALLAAVIVLQIVTMAAVFGKKDAAAKQESGASDLNLDVVQIDSPYCVLKYPSLYMEELVFEEKREGAVYSAIFGCKINGKQQTLFTLHFNSEETEKVAATVYNKGNPIPVVLEMAELQTDLWTKEELKTVKKMQKAKDTVIQSIKDHDDIY